MAAAILQALDPMIRRDEPESVHDMRVATRRLRSAQKSFGKIEVLASYLHARLAELPADLLMGPVQARVSAHFAPRAAAARASLQEALDSLRSYSRCRSNSSARGASGQSTAAGGTSEDSQYCGRR